MSIPDVTPPRTLPLRSDTLNVLAREVLEACEVVDALAHGSPLPRPYADSVLCLLAEELEPVAHALQAIAAGLQEQELAE